jgi:hypothetical protein
MNLQRARVTLTVHAGEASRTILAGQLVDFEDEIRPGVSLGGCVRPEHFDPELPLPAESLAFEASRVIRPPRRSTLERGKQ